MVTLKYLGKTAKEKKTMSKAKQTKIKNRRNKNKVSVSEDDLDVLPLQNLF